MRDTATQEQVTALAQEAVDNARKVHNQWHWDTHLTACPWGCGDGSGIKTA